MASILDALLGRVPPNGGGPNATQGGGRFQPQGAPLGGASSAGRNQSYPNPRAEAAGYTTSAPGWSGPYRAPDAGQFPAAPAGPPTDMSVAGPWGAGMGPPATTGAIGGGAVPTPTPAPRGPGQPPPISQDQLNGPPPIPLEQLGPALNTPLGALSGVPPQLQGTQLPPAPNPALAGVPPALDMPPVNNPALRGPPPDLKGPAKPQPLEAGNPRFGGDEKTSSTKKPSTKKGGRLKSQYNLMKDRRSNK
jgi:hypothetical protein